MSFLLFVVVHPTPKFIHHTANCSFMNYSRVGGLIKTKIMVAVGGYVGAMVFIGRVRWLG